MKNLFRTFLLVSTLLVGCAKEDGPGTILLPSNLVYTITVSPDQEGLVEVSASASNANFYSFEFFHANGSEYVENNDGTASYTYQDSGTFLIIFKAHASASNFIEEQDSVTVIIGSNNGGIPGAGYTTPLSYPGYTLVWNDEFDGNSLSGDWTHEVGRGSNGWGNNELQYYRPQNTEVRDGYLVITSKKEPFGGAQYTSSRIITQGKQSFKYGRIDVRAVLPQGQGLWPAVWMLGDSFGSLGWPKCGEIDIMEMVGGDKASEGDDFVHGTVHWDNNGQHAEYGGSNQLSNGIFADEFHVFSIIWDANKITWYRDDIKFHEINITPAGLSEFQESFFLIMNVAVGGNWPGSPNASTTFPQFMAVDYVRVFQK